MKAVLPQDLRDWGSYWQIFDTCNLGPAINPKVNGWFETFTEMADAPEIAFLNVRNESEAGRAYTNITSKDKFPWWFDLNSIGLRFIFPDPATNVGSEHLGISTMAKHFCATLPEHCVIDFKIRSYTFLTLKGAHMPAGMGPTGYFELNTGSNNAFSGLINNGESVIGNRWKFLGNETIPKDTPVAASLYFDDWAKTMLRKWATVPGIDLGDEEEFPNMPQIEMTLRGIRYEQRPGEFRK